MALQNWDLGESITMSHVLMSSLLAYLRTLANEGAIVQATCDNAERLAAYLGETLYEGFGFPKVGLAQDGQICLSYDDGVLRVDFEVNQNGDVVCTSFNRAIGTTRYESGTVDDWM